MKHRSFPSKVTAHVCEFENGHSRSGEYIGYCNGAQSIRRGGQGWETYRLASAAGVFTYATASTLFELGGKLAHIAANTRADRGTGLVPADCL